MDERHQWRGECANHVLDTLIIHSRLSSRRGIDHGEQGGGDIHETYAAHICGCGEAAQVSHHAAAQINQERLARGTVLEQKIPNALHGSEGLAPLARLKGEQMVGHIADKLSQKGQTMLNRMAVREYKQLPLWKVRKCGVDWCRMV